MNDSEVIVRQSRKLADLEVALEEARELVLLLAGELVSTVDLSEPIDTVDLSEPIEIAYRNRAESVQVERVEGGVRFQITKQQEE